MEVVDTKADREELHRILEKHVAATGSKKAQKILADFDQQVAHFKKIIPSDYKEMLRLTAKNEEQGMSHEEAQIEAFTEMMK